MLVHLCSKRRFAARVERLRVGGRVVIVDLKDIKMY
jgi:hypothetical protein